MKTNFTFFTLLLSAIVFNTNLMAQDCSNLIISEVIEGWSNNKAIEIYNPTSSAIDASGFGLVRFQNGSTTPGNITYLEGAIIEPYDVYVVVIDKTNPDGVDFEAPVWDELQLQADVFVNPLYNDGAEVMYFNGNDALALLTDEGETLVDVFGKIGDSVNPDGWGGYLDSEGEQAYISENHTLVRKASIVQGYTANPETFEILNEYDSLPANTFDQLGFHSCNCNPNNIAKYDAENQVRVFPNPIQNGFVTIASLERISEINVFEVSGKMVHTENVGSVQNTYMDLSKLPQGTYFLKARLESGVEVTEILVK